MDGKAMMFIEEFPLDINEQKIVSVKREGVV
jgi:hypothetical protein